MEVWQPALNDWVLIRPPKSTVAIRTLWKDAFPGLIQSVSPSGTFSVLVPNLLVLQHRFKGSAYTVRDGLAAKDVRKYEGHDRQALTQALLTSFMQNKFDAAPASPHTRYFPVSKQVESTVVNLGKLCDMLPDFGGRLAEYLWAEVATDQVREEKVSKEDIGWISDGAYVTHSVPIKEPEVFQLMRASPSICSRSISGMKGRFRTVCDSDVSCRFISIICGVSKAAFPQRWAKSRCLLARPTLEEDHETIETALEDMENVQHDRRKASRKRIVTEQLLSPEEAEDLRSYNDQSNPFNFVGYDVPYKTLAEVCRIVSARLSRQYLIDPYIVAVTWPEVRDDVHKHLDISEEIAWVSICTLHKMGKVSRSGDLIFPL